MKRFFMLGLSLFFFTALNSSCQNQQKDTTATNETNYAKLTSQKTAEVPSTCLVPGDPFEITSECANNYINDWKNGPFANKAGMGGDSKYIVRGFHIKQGELKDILNKMGDDIEVWAWLAIEEDEAALIFEITDTTGVKASGPKYYDFTTPCPNFCPI